MKKGGDKKLISLQTEIAPLVLLILVFFSSIAFYYSFPSIVPTHWNWAGQADSWSAPDGAAFFFPLLISAIYLLMLILPWLDPRREKYPQFARAYHAIKNSLIGFMAMLYWLIALNGLGVPLRLNFFMPILVGLLFIVIGSFLNEVKSNWFIGIRTPWTLSSETVWKKTHQFGSKLFVLSGIIFILLAWLPVYWQWPLLIMIMLLLAFGSLGYSYWVYLKEKNRGFKK